MAHVQLSDKADRLIPKVALRYSRRRFGRVVEPVAAAAHHSGVLLAMGALETAAERGWRRLDQDLRWLVIQAAAMEIGCSWCTDYGYYEGLQQGTDPNKVREVLHWRTSGVFDEPRASRARVRRSGDRHSGDDLRRAHGAAAPSLQRARDRGTGCLGGDGELPVALQRRSRPSESGVLGQLRCSDTVSLLHGRTKSRRRSLSARRVLARELGRHGGGWNTSPSHS